MEIDEFVPVQLPEGERERFDPCGLVQGERRSGIDRRQFSYAIHLPERRHCKERRCTNGDADR